MSGPTHAAFLRAVNLGKTRKASSADLVSCFEGMGFEDVATFRTSGNVVFTGKGSAKKLRAEIEKGLSDSFGFEVPVLLRTAKQLAAIAAQTPFPAKAVGKSKGKLQVALLAKKAPAAALTRAEGIASDDDQLVLDGTELYWLPAAGTLESPLGMQGIDKTMGPNTMRTMGTIEQIHSKFFDG